MALPGRRPTIELINVHQVRGDKDAILYLKNAEHEYVEGLFYNAKRYGKSEFYFRGSKYSMLHNKDASFSIELSADQEINTEEFA